MDKTGIHYSHNGVQGQTYSSSQRDSKWQGSYQWDGVGHYEVLVNKSHQTDNPCGFALDVEDSFTHDFDKERFVCPTLWYASALSVLAIRHARQTRVNRMSAASTGDTMTLVRTKANWRVVL